MNATGAAESTPGVVRVEVAANQQALARAAAQRAYGRIAAHQNTHAAPFRLVLTGGGAGIEFCRELAALEHAARVSAEDFPVQRIDWSRVLVFFGDERFVPEGDAQRNELQATEALLSQVPVPPDNVFRIAAAPPGHNVTEPAGRELDAAAAEYEHVVRREAPEGFDLHLLGMGPEGHINSLFPHTPELCAPLGWVMPVRECPKAPPNRVTLTLPLVNQSRAVWLLVAGEAKKKAAAEVLRRGDAEQWPAAGAAGVEETVLWVDAAADPRNAQEI